MLKELAQYPGRIAKIDGPARSGKTEVLVQRCINLLEQGVIAESILVVVSSEMARVRFRTRLEDAAPENLKGQSARIVVSRALDVCTSILDTPTARETTGRIPRILDNNEYLFFMEDLKTLGQKNQRLYNMLLFFYAQWSKFEDEKEWLIPGEESKVLDHARNLLIAYGAMLRHEAPYLCGKLLLSEAGQVLTQRYDFVLCDDFQNLSHAEQVCMCLCARKQVMVCGDSLQATKVNTDYPYVAGFEKFERLRKNVDVFALDETYGITQAIRFGEALYANEDKKHYPASTVVENPHSKAIFLEWETPEDELSQLGSLVHSFCELSPENTLRDIAIAVPNKRWGRLVQTALKQQSIKSSVAGLNPSVGGDPRAAGYHDALSAYVKLALVANPEDIVAWRAWTGFDSALTNSEVWAKLHKSAQEQGVSLYSVLKNAAETKAEDSASILKKAVLEKAWNSAQSIIASCQGLRGFELTQALGLNDLPVFNETLQALSGDEDATTVYEQVKNAFARPHFPSNSNCVHIVLYENLCGLDYSCLILPGMVNGLIPFRDAFDAAKSVEKQQQIIDEDRGRLYSAISKGTQVLITSTFTQTDIETAERTKMKVNRIASIKGKRVALLDRSTFFREADTACSDFIDGEKVMTGHFFQKE